MIPQPGFGTYKLGDHAYDAISSAIELGYRHLDTAQYYFNEEIVGRAVNDSAVPRGQLFVTTKVWHDRLNQRDFLPSVEESLEKLQLDYVDLLLVHWPEPTGQVPMAEYLGELAKAKQQGLAKHIGVSNFTIKLLDEAVDILGPGEILTNQIEVHPFLQNSRVRAHCAQLGIQVTGFMPLARGRVFEDDTLRRIAQRHGVSPADIAVAWENQLGVITIPASTKVANQQANLAALNITLSDADMADIAALDRGQRLADSDFAPVWD